MKYNSSLDGIRGIAILFVAFFHWRIPPFAGGFIGVDIFFVLSGYLITTILLNEIRQTGQIDLKEFYIRRARRLYPALLGMVGLYLLLLPFAADKLARLQDAGLALFYLSDYSMAYFARPKLLVHTWSLSVEEQFYLMWPLVLVLIQRVPGRRWRLVTLCAIAVCFTVNRLLFAAPFRIYYSFDTRIDTILYGGLLAAWAVTTQKKVQSMLVPAIAWGGLLTLVAAPTARTFLGPWEYSAVTVFSILLILTAVQEGYPISKKVLSAPPLVWFGKRAYGLYLWHYPIVGLFKADLTGWHLPATILISLVATEISYRYIEQPFLKRRTKLAPQLGAVEPTASLTST